MLHNKSKTKISGTSVGTMILTGGLNEEASNLELNSGELIDCQNYMEVDGSVSGYLSFPGYERYDGRTSPSSVALNVNPTTGVVIDDISREAARTAILAMDGTGISRGVAIYENVVYGWRDLASPSTELKMYKATSGGWSGITCTTMLKGGTVRYITGRFSLYKSNATCMFWVDGVSPLHTYDGTTAVAITHTSLPATLATVIGMWNNRLFLAYPGGHIFFSKIGDPTEFDGALGAGEIHIGDTVTDFEISTSGDLIIFTKDSIHTIMDNTTSIGDFQFVKNIFSHQSGAFASTTKRMLGTIFYADDRGITTLEATAAYGDLAAKTISKKVNKTFLENRSKISTAIINRQYNQYLLVFNEGASHATAILLSFASRKLKGCFKIKLSHPIYSVAEGKDSSRNDVIYFTSNAGYIYKLYTGTSFDGAEIPTWLQTSFYHYGSPTRWKNFRGLTFEIEAEGLTQIDYRCYFDYKATSFPTTETTTKTYDRAGGVWGDGVWGTFLWGSQSLSRSKIKILGYGTSMSIKINTSEKYRQPHSIHNCLIEYSVGNKQN